MNQDNYIKILTVILIQKNNKLSKENNKVSNEDLVKKDDIILNNKFAELDLKNDISDLELNNNNKLNIDIQKINEINTEYFNNNLKLNNENSNLKECYNQLESKYDNLKLKINNYKKENIDLKDIIIKQKANINNLKRKYKIDIIKNNIFFHKKINRKNDIIKNLIKKLNHLNMVNYDYPDLLDDDDNNSSYDLR